VAAVTKKVLVTGSREFDDPYTMTTAISAEFDEERHLILIHGDARGADSLADYLGRESKYITVVKVPADWRNLPKWEAGPLRNKHMLDLGPDVVLAFFKDGAKNSGTKNCVKQARERGIPVKEFTA
jgi:hypothetical protein